MIGRLRVRATSLRATPLVLVVVAVVVGVMFAADRQGPAEAAEQTVTITWGPYAVPGGTQANPSHTSFLTFMAQKPCTNCHVVAYEPDLVLADQTTTANFATDAMMHHMVAFSNIGADITCPSGAPWSALGRRIFAAGNERTSFDLPDGYGLFVTSGENWAVNADIMNFGPAQNMYLKFDFTYRPASDGYKSVTPAWLDVNNCGNSQYAIPAGLTDTHVDWNSTVTGDIISVGGHVHDYGINISTQHVQSGQYLCSSVAGYAPGSPWKPAPLGSGDANHPAQANTITPGDPNYEGHIEDMAACHTLFRVNAGETMRLHARYNAAAPVPDAMGISVIYIYETTTPVVDSDSDGVREELDNCPMWANPSQNTPNWSVPANDPDCDNFTTATETFIGTDPNKQCAANAGVNNDPPPDRWPTDFNDSQSTNTIDVGFFVPVLNKSAPGPPYSVRFDFNGNGTINSIDVGRFVPVLNKNCS